MFILFASAVFLNAPGASLLAIVVDSVGLRLDLGQVWTFSIIISVLIFIMLKLISNNYINQYLKLCSVVILFYLVAYFGFHSETALRHYHYLIPD